MMNSKIDYFKEFTNIFVGVMKITLAIIAIVFTMLIFGRVLILGMMLDNAAVSSQKTALIGYLDNIFRVFFIVLIPVFMAICFIIIRYAGRGAIKCVKFMCEDKV